VADGQGTHGTAAGTKAQPFPFVPVHFVDIAREAREAGLTQNAITEVLTGE
jgi:hypothetical protein